jgi:uncharacterized protein (DUF488 family)
MPETEEGREDPARVFSVGHSTHAAARFLHLLRAHHVRCLADVRRYPASRRHPDFESTRLEALLEEAGIAYAALGAELGGRRRARPGSANEGWRVEGFRAYADHMDSAEFRRGLARLEELARRSSTAVMCAEANWRRCHRQLIADALVVRGWRVEHILHDGRLERHRLTPFAVIEAGRISYPAPQGRLR